MFIERFRAAALESCRLDASLPLVVGVSGGPDSLCLLDCLLQCGFRPLVAHFDHCLRAESARDAEKVAELAAGRGLDFELGRLDVAAYAGEAGLSLEEAAREARYRFLFAAARRTGAQAVAVGHTADDQVETVLMHLLRGAGLAGLKGMSARSLHEGFDASIPLARPLLGFWREEIEAYCRERGLQPLQDATNADPAFYRNRLRHELIPFLARYNPQVKQVLWRTADVLAGEAEVLAQAAQAAWGGVVERCEPDLCALRREALLDLPVGLQRAVLRRAIQRLRPALRDIDYQTVERGLGFIRRPTRSGSLSLAQGLRLEQAGGVIYLAEWDATLLDRSWPQVQPGALLRLDVPGELPVGQGWVLRAEPAEPPAGFSEAGRWEAWLDSAQVELPLEVRSARPGERFQPLGLGGRSQKIADLWINVRLPRRARSGWPLVLSGGAVAWVPGYRLDERFKVSGETRQAIHLVLEKPAVD